MNSLSRHWSAAWLPSLLLCLLVGCRSSEESVAERTPTAVRVRTVLAQQTEIARSTSQPATVHAYFETEIRAKVHGYVVEVEADIGDVVRTGQILLKIDIPELEKRRETLRAEVDLLTAGEQAAHAGVQLSQASVRSAEARLAQAKSELIGIEAAVKAAESEFQRTEDLVRRGSLQRRLLDEVTAKRDAELATQQAVQAAVVAAEAEVAVAQAERASAEARLRSAEAQTMVAKRRLEELEVEMAFAEVRAPFEGIITERNVNMGELIENRSGHDSKPLYVLQMVSKLRIQVPVPENEAPFVQVGDSVQLQFPSFSSQPPLQAVVTRRSGSLDPSTRTMTVEAEVENLDGKLLPGMFGQATLESQTSELATMLPSRAVRFDEEGRAYVYIVNDDDRVRLSEVTPGLDTGTDIVIHSGVEPGERVLGPHLKRFSEGQLVEPL